MTRIGILSDTHGCWDERYLEHFASCDQIWHAGDIGTMEVADRLATFRMLRAVHGNIDGADIRRIYPEMLRFRCEDVDVLIKHIGGYPGRYDPSIAPRLRANPPQLFISGHSHILKIKYDNALQLLHINPGAAGYYGWQPERTLVTLTIEGNKMTACQVISLAHKSTTSTI